MGLFRYETSHAAVDAMQEAFSDFWALQAIQPPVTFDNVDIDAALSADLTIASTDPDVAGEGLVIFSVTHGGGEIAALGTRVFKQFGVVGVSVLAETNKGRIRAVGKIADQALDFFQTADIPGVLLQDQRLTENGTSGRFRQLDVFASFVYYLNRE